MGERTTHTQSRKAGSSARLGTLPYVEAPSMKPVLASVKSALLAFFGGHVAARAGRTRASNLRYVFGAGISISSSSRDGPGVYHSPSIMCSNYLDAGMTLALGGSCGSPILQSRPL